MKLKTGVISVGLLLIGGLSYVAYQFTANTEIEYIILNATEKGNSPVQWLSFRYLQHTDRIHQVTSDPKTTLGFVLSGHGEAFTDKARVEELAKLLTGRGLDIDERDVSGMSPLHDAVLINRPDSVRFILELGASTSVRSRRPGGSPADDKTPLELALWLQENADSRGDMSRVVTLLRTHEPAEQVK